jgi:tetratricopeptide (TPR) repeat protein
VNAMAPMESDTSNGELLKRKVLLERLLDGQVSKEEFAAAKALNAHPKEDAPEDQQRLAKLIDYLSLEDLPPKAAVGSLERDFAVGQFYFYERRFIEASQIFSKLLDKKPGLLRVRNLLARCFYFLGNMDRSYLELQYVLTNHSGQAEELLDALFLMGALAMDSPSATAEQIEKGIGAWQTYLKLAPKSPLTQKIKDGLVTFEEKKKGKAAVAVTGNAKKDALSAVEGGDMLDAESKVTAALKKTPHDEELKVGLARVFVKTGRVSEALAEFGSVIRKNPRNVVAFHYQGMAHMMSGNPQGAIASWEKVLQLDAAYGDRFNLRGRIAIAQNLVQKEAS